MSTLKTKHIRLLIGAPPQDYRYHRRWPACVIAPTLQKTVARSGGGISQGLFFAYWSRKFSLTCTTAAVFDIVADLRTYLKHRTYSGSGSAFMEDDRLKKNSSFFFFAFGYRLCFVHNNTSQGVGLQKQLPHKGLSSPHDKTDSTPTPQG